MAPGFIQKNENTSRGEKGDGMNGRFQRTLLCGLLAGQIAWALPEGGQVIQGGVQIGQPQNNILQILQSSPSGIINWNSFNIDHNQLVQFLQPGASSALLNRVIGQDPSQIFGQIQANGRIFLVNPNGILFGPGSSVNAGSFMATTLSIADQDFMQGRYNLRQDPSSPLRAVVNQGDIRVTEGGFIALISPVVDNQGLLLAERGQVVLGATSQASLTVDARGLLQVSIPDGFAAHSQVPGTPQTVMLTQGQMSEALSNLVTHSGNESDKIIETAQGIQLVGGEGLLVNQGTVQASGGQVLMDSSQATLNTRDSLVSVSSSQGDAGEIRVLSAGSAVQDGRLEARSSVGQGGFIELSGHTVGLHSTPALSAGGRFLLDPALVSIVTSGGDGTNTIDANTLDTGAASTVMADDTLTVEDNVQILLANPTQLTLQGTTGNVLMKPGSSVNATDPTATLTVIAGATATLSNLIVPSVDITANDVILQSGQLGVAGQPTVVTVNSANIEIVQDANINVEGSSANVTFDASNNFFFGAGSQFNINAPGYLTAHGNGDATTLLDNSLVRLAGPGNITLSSNASGVFLEQGSVLQADSAANITLAAPNGELFLPGTITATNPASVLQASSKTGQQVHTIAVPTMSFIAADPTLGFVKFFTGNLGVATTATVLDAQAQSISFDFNSDVHVLGTHADVTLNSSKDFAVFHDTQVHLDSPNSNLTITSPMGGFIEQNSQVRASGNANITLQSAGQPLSLGDGASVVVDGSGRIDLSNSNSDVGLGTGAALRLGSGNITLSSGSANVVAFPNSSVTVDGVGNVTVSTPGGKIDFRDGSTISAPTPGNKVVLTARDDVFVPGVAATSLNVTSNTGNVIFTNGSIGVAGQNSVINAVGRDINFSGAGPTTLVGNNVAANITGSGDFLISGTQSLRSQAARTDANITVGGAFKMFSGGTLTDSGLGNYTIQANSVSLDTGSSISIANPAGRIAMNTTQDLTTAGLAVSNINLHAGGTQFYNPGVIGRAGSPTSLTAASDHDLFFFNGGPLQLVGSSLNWTQSATGNTFLAVDSDMRFEAGNNNANFTITGFITAGAGARISGQSPTQLAISAGSFGLDGSSINLPNPASSLNLQSAGVVRLNQVTVGSLDVNTAGNVRVVGQVEANNVRIQTPLELINDVPSSNAPAIIAHQNLNLTAARISGPVNLADANLVQAFPIATDGTAIVRINVTGTNSSTQGNRAANLFYYFPQSADIQVTNPNGEVLIVNQPNPNPAPPATPSGPRIISSRADLTPGEFAQLTQDAAQPQIQLSNLYSAALLPSTSSVLMLGYNNIGLTHYAPVPLSTPLLELAVLSPEAASSQVRARQDSSASGPDGSPTGTTGSTTSGTTGSTTSGSATGTAPRTDGSTTSGSTTGSTTGTTGSSTSGSTTTTGTGISRADTPTVETGVLSPEGTSNRNRDDSRKTDGRDDQATSQTLAGNDEDEELRYWRKLIEGFIIWEDE